MTSIVLITGASRGIGAATALLAARQGWDVAVNYSNNEGAAREVVQAVQALGRRAIAVQADVANEAQVLAMFARVDAELGRISALVNNAGVVDRAQRLQDMDLARWRRMFDINVIGSFICAREAVRRMSTAEGGAGGSIVNVSSRAACLGAANQYVDYAAAKSAIDTMTLGLSHEVASQGIRVNAVRPGLIETEIHASGGQPDRIARLAPGVPMGRGGTADEVAEAICWLMSDKSSYSTGAIIDVSGGR
ncbi:NAD(P)-dependent dehydrogenase (short-subunit alcohol dehydrogenase family) [Comamonas odontotermitis]|uniref:NAD(P)-dependent dehydrogenase (Short-subunit alcohol dehydrogenase family) n=1 Tax=Comamonas odontotermitis TaxID=379895 RepID=A0ABR6RB50_9BURK|nr:SDR family oxidoreductase [Comamonas odontotermitis]MBB6576368.1 NAD(P)-dependent dehydrogenase (short-subunit alcohol dehydrogenase family) [Comamonas odontotermitis]